MIPNDFLDFDPRTPPPPPPAPGYPFLGGGGVGGGGGKTSLCIVAAVCVFGPGSWRTFFLYMDPLTHGGGPGSQLQVPPVTPPYMAPRQ